MSLSFLVYVSTATDELADTELRSLLEQSRVVNHQHQVSGMLLYVEGCFMQLLEGPQARVEQLYENICRDVRNHSNVIIDQGAIEERFFDTWHMGFAAISRHDLDSTDAYLALRGLSILEGRARRLSGAVELLQEFYRNNAHRDAVPR